MSDVPILNLETLLSRAHAMEMEAATRYAELAAQMAAHNNPEVASLFQKLSEIEHRHAEAIVGELAAHGAVPSTNMPLSFAGQEGAETSPSEELEYLMTPYHALQIALRNEERAFAFFEHLAGSDVPDDIRAAARDFASEEQLHIRLVRDWLARVPTPSDDWAYDPDEAHSPD